MADNITTSGATLATDDIGGVHHQRVKLSVGADGSAADAVGGAGAVTSGVQRVTLASDDPAVSALSTINAGLEYETVAASQTAQVLGATGASGDVLDSLVIIPASTSPGAVSIADGNGTAITVFAGGASSVSNLVPFSVALGMRAVNGTTPGWKVTTGASVSVIAVGNFT